MTVTKYEYLQVLAKFKKSVIGVKEVIIIAQNFNNQRIITLKSNYNIK